MSKLSSDEVITGVIGLFVGILATLIVASNITEHHSNIIKHGCGKYNSQTAKFEWIKHD